MYLLDTNICIYFFKKSYPALTKKLLALDSKKIAISSITIFELKYGAAKSKWGERTRHLLELFLSPLTVIPFDSDDADIAGELRGKLEGKGMPIGPYDLQIAAQALARNMTLVTHNTKEFGRIPGLKIEDWTTTK